MVPPATAQTSSTAWARSSPILFSLGPDPRATASWASHWLGVTWTPKRVGSFGAQVPLGQLAAQPEVARDGGKGQVPEKKRIGTFGAQASSSLLADPASGGAVYKLQRKKMIVPLWAQVAPSPAGSDTGGELPTGWVLPEFWGAWFFFFSKAPPHTAASESTIRSRWWQKVLWLLGTPVCGAYVPRWQCTMSGPSVSWHACSSWLILLAGLISIISFFPAILIWSYLQTTILLRVRISHYYLYIIKSFNAFIVILH